MTISRIHPARRATGGAQRRPIARRWRASGCGLTLAAAVFFAALVIAAIGAEVNLRTLFTYFGNFISYFDRILTLEDGTRVWSNLGRVVLGLAQMAVDARPRPF